REGPLELGDGLGLGDVGGVELLLLVAERRARGLEVLHRLLEALLPRLGVDGADAVDVRLRQGTIAERLADVLARADEVRDRVLGEVIGELELLHPRRSEERADGALDLEQGRVELVRGLVARRARVVGVERLGALLLLGALELRAIVLEAAREQLREHAE